MLPKIDPVGMVATSRAKMHSGASERRAQGRRPIQTVRATTPYTVTCDMLQLWHPSE